MPHLQVLFQRLAEGKKMISSDDIIGKWKSCTDLTGKIEDNITKLLIPVMQDFLSYVASRDVELHKNPKTGTLVSGSEYGGFRPQDCTIGAPKSNHKQGLAVDIYDPHNELDKWCMANRSVLVEYGIWLEHPDATPGWCHMQVVPPRSGNRVFRP